RIPAPGSQSNRAAPGRGAFCPGRNCELCLGQTILAAARSARIHRQVSAMDYASPAAATREAAKSPIRARLDGGLPRCHASPRASASALARTALGLSLPEPARVFLDKLLAIHLLEPAAITTFLGPREDRLREYTSGEGLGQALVQEGLLTPYQFERVLAGN